MIGPRRAERLVFVLRDVLQRHASAEDAEELARNIAAPLVLDFGPTPMTVEEVAYGTLSYRRRRFPRSPWARLTMQQICQLASDADRAWARHGRSTGTRPQAETRR